MNPTDRSPNNLRPEDKAAKTILIVDDNPNNLLLLQKIIIKTGYDSDIAVNGLEALKMASEKDYDLILLDIMMPVMNGLETARLLRERTDRKRPYIVAVTAAEPEECQRLIQTDHIDDFIRKGNHFATFSEKIQRLLEA